MNTINLNCKTNIKIDVEKGFSLEKTFYSPSRFITNMELYKDGCYYHTINMPSLFLGIKFSMNNGSLLAEVFTENKIDRKTKKKIEDEIKFRLGRDYSLKDFYLTYKNDKYLKKPIRNNSGKNSYRLYNLYENLIITTFLQNATVERTTSMCRNMLEKYGYSLKYDGVELFAMWQPYELSQITEDELRLLKVGYRAKNIKRITESFLNNNFSDEMLRELPTDALENELLKIYGVGKQTVLYIIGRPDYLKHVPLWERKILSKYLFDVELMEENLLVNWFRERYGKCCRTAFSLIFENIFSEHKVTPFPWLKTILRED